MEGFGGLQTMEVSVKIDCCKAFPKRLKKSLLKIKGVRFVTVDVEKNLVSVVGSNADPQRVLEAISEMAEAQVLSDEKEPLHHIDKNSTTSYETMDSSKKEKKQKQKSGINKVGCGSNDQLCDAAKSGLSDHKVESYYPPSCNDGICYDPYCFDHNKWEYNQFLPSGRYGGYGERGIGCIVM